MQFSPLKPLEKLYGELSTPEGYFSWTGWVSDTEREKLQELTTQLSIKAAAYVLSEALPWTKTNVRLPTAEEYDTNEEVFWQYGGRVTRIKKHEVDRIKWEDPGFLNYCYWRRTGYVIPEPFVPKEDNVLPT